MQVYTAPPNSGTVQLGRTLVSLYDEACEQRPNPRAFNQPDGSGAWRSLSNNEARKTSEEIACGARALGLERGDKAAFFLNSDLYFALCDTGTLIAGVVNVPIYTTNPPETTRYVLEHSESQLLIVADEAFLEGLVSEVLPHSEAKGIKTVVLCEGEPGRFRDRMPDGMALLHLDDLRAKGRDYLQQHPDAPREMREEMDAKDLATLIYTSGTTGTPKGVMLTHENMSSNVTACFTGFEGMAFDASEVGLNFLPMTHVFARTLLHLHNYAGHTLYFSNPDQLVEHLAEVKPTMFATVPRVLEKVMDKVEMGITSAEGAKKTIGEWALALARKYEIGTEPAGLAKLKYGLADKLVYSKLREKLGLTRINIVVSGGAALRKDLANAFTAFGVPVMEGYGLTETSPVITFNRPAMNRAGTVGPPLEGCEVAIAEDGEILARGPNIMQGYYKAPDKTAEVMDDDGWFHTGDIGEMRAAMGTHFLAITDRKKDLFKLSTGKYVMPTPIELELLKSVMIEQAVVMGSGQKFCTALLFPSEDGLRGYAREEGLAADRPMAELVKDPKVQAEYERIVGEANKRVPEHWSQIKRFTLIPELMTIDNEMLTPTMKVKRPVVRKNYGEQMDRLYTADVARKDVAAVA